MAKKSLRGRIFLPTVATITVCFILVFGIIVSHSYTNTEAMAKEILYETALRSSVIVARVFDRALTTAEGMADYMAEVLRNIKIQNREQVASVISGYFRDESFSGAWVDTEPNLFDGRDAEYAHAEGYDKNGGRFAPFWTRDEGGFQYSIMTSDGNNKEEEGSEYYWMAKESGRPAITNPYSDSDAEDALMVSLTAPFYNPGGKFAGVAGVDIRLSNLSAIVNNIRLVDRGRFAVIAENGTWAIHPDAGHLLKDIGAAPDMLRVKEALREGREVFARRQSEMIGEDAFLMFVPVTFGASPQKWGLVVEVPAAVALKSVYELLLISLVSAGCILLLLIIVLSFVMSRILKPMQNVFDHLYSVCSQIHETSSDVGAKSLSVSAGTEEQAKALVWIGDSLQEFREFSKDMGEQTLETNELMTRYIRESDAALRTLADLAESMQQIESDNSKVGAIIRSIDEIAFQTNLLALNAAIEAARAGEAGTSFAVVADEVRGLAARSADAASDTQELLQGTMAKISDAALQLRRMNGEFSGIIESATDIGKKTSLLADTSNKQAARVEGLVSSANTIGDGMHQVSEQAKESSSSVGKLSVFAGELRKRSQEMAALILGREKGSATTRIPPSGRSARRHGRAASSIRGACAYPSARAPGRRPEAGARGSAD